MDKKFWDLIGTILVVSNALGIVVLFEMLFFKFPYITLFLFIFYCMWEVNKKMFKKFTRIKAHKTNKTEQHSTYEAKQLST